MWLRISPVHRLTFFCADNLGHARGRGCGRQHQNAANPTHGLDHAATQPVAAWAHTARARDTGTTRDEMKLWQPTTPRLVKMPLGGLGKQ